MQHLNQKSREARLFHLTSAVSGKRSDAALCALFSAAAADYHVVIEGVADNGDIISETH